MKANLYRKEDVYGSACMPINVISTVCNALVLQDMKRMACFHYWLPGASMPTLHQYLLVSLGPIPTLWLVTSSQLLCTWSLWAQPQFHCPTRRPCFTSATLPASPSALETFTSLHFMAHAWHSRDITSTSRAWPRKLPGRHPTNQKRKIPCLLGARFAQTATIRQLLYLDTIF